MKNLTIQRGLVCLSEDEFKRVMSEVSALENSNDQLKKQLEESKSRITLLEETVRVTEGELRLMERIPNETPIE